MSTARVTSLVLEVLAPDSSAGVSTARASGSGGVRASSSHSASSSARISGSGRTIARGGAASGGSVTYAEITPTSQPSETQVEDWLDDAEAEVRAALRSVELRDTYDPTDDADALRILRRRVVDFAAGLTKLAWASADGDAEKIGRAHV